MRSVQPAFESPPVVVQAMYFSRLVWRTVSTSVVTVSTATAGRVLFSVLAATSMFPNASIVD
ncbi:hypothetical protein AWB83_02810 [Caballeronia ptereochthonis]|uniref:Uncharacterized protein n=1 Tax=Caballeronia ptereochthonis TaxID=1777144 RepID=A0A158B5S3_9BURK|nr:hypothetical protein AWB83_02810 [Caballeronia ptereochthonis]